MQHLDPETISSYIDRELSTEEVAQVEAHLASCQQCRQEHREFLTVSQMVQALPAYRPRTSAVVKGRLAKLPARDLARFVRPLAVAAILMLTAVTGLAVLGEILGPETDGTNDESSSSQTVADTPADDESAMSTLQESQEAPALGQLAVATEAAGDTGSGEPSTAGQIRIALYVAMGAGIIGAAVWLHAQRIRRE